MLNAAILGAIGIIPFAILAALIPGKSDKKFKNDTQASGKKYKKGDFPEHNGIYLCELKHKIFATSFSKREYKDGKWYIPDNFTLISWSEHKD